MGEGASARCRVAWLRFLVHSGVSSATSERQSWQVARGFAVAEDGYRLVPPSHSAIASRETGPTSTDLSKRTHSLSYRAHGEEFVVAVAVAGIVSGMFPSNLGRRMQPSRVTHPARISCSRQGRGNRVTTAPVSAIAPLLRCVYVARTLYN